MVRLEGSDQTVVRLRAPGYAARRLGNPRGSAAPAVSLSLRGLSVKGRFGEPTPQVGPLPLRLRLRAYP